MQNLRDIIMNEPAEARLTRQCEAEAQAGIVEAAARHNYATLLLKLRKDGFSLQEALRRADLIMPSRGS